MTLDPTSVDRVRTADRRVRFAVALVGVQGLAAAFFVADSLLDAQAVQSNESVGMSWLEAGVAAALLAGIALGGLLIRQLLIERREMERTVSIARGALAAVIAERFADWRLSAAEADVALFALKGFGSAEIAQLRGSAEGTVRAQLSQVYSKAGVASRAMFVAMFVEDLLEG